MSRPIWTAELDDGGDVRAERVTVDGADLFDVRRWEPRAEGEPATPAEIGLTIAWAEAEALALAILAGASRPVLQ
jgi:hypothetical protein